MLENRNLKRDLLALALLAAVIFLAASLFSYDPADPPAKLVYPPHSQPANVCGYLGRHRQPVALRGGRPRGLFRARFARGVRCRLCSCDATSINPGFERSDGCSRWSASPPWPRWPCPAFRRAGHRRRRIPRRHRSGGAPNAVRPGRLLYPQHQPVARRPAAGDRLPYRSAAAVGHRQIDPQVRPRRGPGRAPPTPKNSTKADPISTTTRAWKATAWRCECRAAACRRQR